MNWIPSPTSSRSAGSSFSAGNYLSTIPFLAADAGNPREAGSRGRLAAAGRPAVRARLLVMAGAVPLILVGLGIGQVTEARSAVVLLSIIAAGTAAFMVNYFAFTQEVSPRHTGLVAGYLGAWGTWSSRASSRSPAG